MQFNNYKSLAVFVCVAFMAVTYLQPAEAFGPITLTLGTTAVVLTGTQVSILSTHFILQLLIKVRPLYKYKHFSCNVKTI